MQTDSTALIGSEVYVQDRVFLSAGGIRAAHAYVPCSLLLIRKSSAEGLETSLSHTVTRFFSAVCTPLTLFLLSL